jgi:branched-chain amino acid transport system permease protein
MAGRRRPSDSLRHHRGRASTAMRLDDAAAQWARLPSRVRAFVPVAIVVGLALLYPWYWQHWLQGYTNIPLILAFPSVHDSVTILVFVMMAVGLNVVVGYAGLLDLGYVAFYALGAYTAGWLASGQFQQVKFHLGSIGIGSDARGIHISIWLAFLAAAIVTAIGGILIGFPTLRLRGDYLAIVTLGFGEIIPQFVRNGDNLHGFDLTHGTFGISPIDSPGFGVWLNNHLGLPVSYQQSFDADRLFYWTVLGLLLLTIFCCARLRDSRLGRAWIAIREDETAAGAMGIPLMRTKTWAYAIGAFWGGVAGAYLASFNSGAFPSQFDFSISVFLLCMVVLGGMGSIWGVVVAGTILSWLNVEGLANIGAWLNRDIFPASHQIDVGKYQFGIYGVIIVLMMLFRPTGLIPERRRKREIEEGTRGPLDEPLYEMRGADEPGAGERGSAGSVPRG